jgi:polyphosphate glucokinase
MAKRAKKRKPSPIVLAIDVGGTHVKVMTSRERVKREFESGPDLSAKDMVKQVEKLTADWSYDVISVGYPGPIVRNRPLAEPYNLGPGWAQFDFEKAFRRPTKVVNDAAMQALGSYEGGRMLFLGLGTGLGSAIVDHGVLEPMELGHTPYRHGKTFENYVGVDGLKRLGLKKWRKKVADIVKLLTAAFEPDYVMLGGGNVKKLDRLPRKARRGDNANAFEGGFRLWDKPGKHRKRAGRS